MMLKYLFFAFHFFSLFLLPVTFFGQADVELWGRFEKTIEYNFKGNAFTEVQFSAEFTHQDTSFIVTGFYDDNDQFKVRFMPQKLGTWKYTTRSNISALNNQKGIFECIKASSQNHGMVEVSDVHHFKFSDGKKYYPFGTTAYAWTHMDEGLQKLTLQTLEKSGFNKVRMCVMPKSYALVQREPKHYPFLIKEIKKDSEGKEVKVWDYEKFNPLFFQRLEKRIDELDAIGVEADLILFHPYDKGRWGFDSMPQEMDIRYIKYITARLSSFKNIWWSLANEWNFLKSKTPADWHTLIETVTAADPYGHLCSIHGSTASYFEYWKPEITHVSIQDEAPVQNPTAAATIGRIYKKPIVFDEVGYEGNITRRWGWLSPEKMMHLIWNGVMGGTYVSHGETYTYYSEKDTIFWANGGALRGSSWKRIKFLRSIIEEIPSPIFMTDISRDFKTASAGEGYYFIYFGEKMQEDWLFNLPVKNGNLKKLKPNAKFKIEIIDAWDMTITPYPGIFETDKAQDYRLFDKEEKKVRLPYKPYIALRITKIN
ncbi:MAG: DUF5060 domain-containing protein [Saprospiraceae bacterium]